MEKIIAKGGYPLAPLPVALVSCGTVEKPLALTISWTGLVCSSPLKVFISVQPVRNSYPAINESGEFVINLPDESMLKAADFCGTNSGRDVDKFKACGITAEKCEHISAPMIAECPISVECRVCEKLSLGSHDMFVADVLAVHVDPKLMTDGKYDFSKVPMLAYANSKYYKLGEFLGNYGVSKTL